MPTGNYGYRKVPKVNEAFCAEAIKCRKLVAESFKIKLARFLNSVAIATRGRPIEVFQELT